MKRLLIATRNPGKARELESLLVGIADTFESLTHRPDVHLPDEGDRSYIDNARGKAVAAFRATGIPTLGDDSGLEVDALDGAPGLYSARFAGADATDAENLDLLLARLRGVPAARRTARFRCALVLVDEDARELVAEGTCEGRILESPRGSEGFGYDPLFAPEGGDRSFAELPGAVKDAISHRGRAIAALRAALGAGPGPDRT